MDGHKDEIGMLSLKKRGFRHILDAEEKHLTHSADLIVALRKCVAEIG